MNKILLHIIIIFSANPVLPQTIPFERHTIDLNFAGIQYVKIIDIDGDNDLDIVGGSETTPYSTSVGIAYWRNDGGQPLNWTRFSVDSTFLHVMSIEAAFIDSDSYPDIVASSWQLNQVAWWKNSGNPQTGWTKHIIKSGYINAHDARCADIDLDQDTDIISVNSNPGSVDICYNQNNLQPSWSYLQLNPGFASAKSAQVIDLDFDSDPDIVGTADGANEIAWWENTGINTQVWQKKVIAANFVGASFADVVDMNSDSVSDILATAWASNEVAYWICNDLQSNQWTKNVVTSNISTPVRAFGCDFDLDGDIDITVIGKMPGKLSVFINENFNWTEQVLYSNFQGGAALAVEDLDNDGDKDIIAGAGVLGDLYWWENKTITTSTKEEGINPQGFFLYQNFPNPFNPVTTIQFSTPFRNKIVLEIYDIFGNEIATLIDKEKEQGIYSVSFDGTGLASGMYICHMRADLYSDSKKMILLK